MQELLATARFSGCADVHSITASTIHGSSLFFFTVPNTLRKTDDFVTLNMPAVDLDHKFRCKVVDCLKFFRKAKLLHYHMKYFHGMEKSPEPEESPGKRHVQTRGSVGPDKASQESLTRKRGSASSPSEYLTFVVCPGRTLTFLRWKTAVG